MSGIPTRIYTFEEVQEYLRMGKTKLYSLLRTGKIAHYKDAGKYLIPADAIADYLQSIED